LQFSRSGEKKKGQSPQVYDVCLPSTLSPQLAQYMSKSE